MTRKESEVLQQGVLLKFLKPANIESLSDETEQSEILSEDIASSNPTPNCLLDDYPGKWPSNLSENMRILLINNRPVQVTDVDFPVDEHGRKFNKAFYNRLSPNGERVGRNWLIYSKHKNRAYCYYCYMFPNKSSMSALLNKVICDWKHLDPPLNDHETSSVHGNAQMKLLELQKRLHYEKTMDKSQRSQTNAEKNIGFVFEEDYCLRSIFGRT
jgi:hypothetical protein